MTSYLHDISLNTLLYSILIYFFSLNMQHANSNQCASINTNRSIHAKSPSSYRQNWQCLFKKFKFKAIVKCMHKHLNQKIKCTCIMYITYKHSHKFKRTVIANINNAIQVYFHCRKNQAFYLNLLFDSISCYKARLLFNGWLSRPRGYSC